MTKLSSERQKGQKSWLKVALLTFYYLAIMLVLLWMEMQGSFVLPKYIYQGF